VSCLQQPGAQRGLPKRGRSYHRKEVLFPLPPPTAFGTLKAHDTFFLVSLAI
jgi:hypothetical protein